jgi:hypothetical protein
MTAPHVRARIHEHNQQQQSPADNDTVEAACDRVCKEYSVPLGLAEGEAAGVWAGCDAAILPELLALRPNEIVLPNDYAPYNCAAAHMMKHFAAERAMFMRANAVVQLIATKDPKDFTLQHVTPEGFCTRLDGHGRRVKGVVSLRGHKVGLALKPKRCSVDIAKKMLASEEVQLLPPIEMITHCSVLVEHDGTLRALGPGYNEQGGGILVLDNANPADVPLDKAVRAILDLTKEFKFATPADQSRAVASFIGPAIRMGQLLPGHALVSVVEADASQTGKSFLQALVRAVYNERGSDIAKRTGGVGSFAQEPANPNDQ